MTTMAVVMIMKVTTEADCDFYFGVVKSDMDSETPSNSPVKCSPRTVQYGGNDYVSRDRGRLWFYIGVVKSDMDSETPSN